MGAAGETLRSTSGWLLMFTTGAGSYDFEFYAQQREAPRTTSGSLLMFSTGAAGTIWARGSSLASSPPKGACSLHNNIIP